MYGLERSRRRTTGSMPRPIRCSLPVVVPVPVVMQAHPARVCRVRWSCARGRWGWKVVGCPWGANPASWSSKPSAVSSTRAVATRRWTPPLCNASTRLAASLCPTGSSSNRHRAFILILLVACNRLSMLFYPFSCIHAHQPPSRHLVQLFVNGSLRVPALR